MCYISSTIAGYFIEKANREDTPLSVLQLIKFAYIAHGWNLALYNSPLISDRIEAWKYGPVMPYLYHLFESFGFTKNSLVNNNFFIEEAKCIKPIHRELLNKVYAKYKRTSGEDLTNLMHEEGTPWSKVWNEEKKDNPIEDKETQLYYLTQINKSGFDALSEYPSIESKDDAIKFLKDAGILLEDGSLNPVYKSSSI